MKIILLFFLITTAVLKLSAQNPTWMSTHAPYGYRLLFEHYAMGYDESLYAWQYSLLKGQVATCTIQEQVSSKEGKWILSYNIVASFNKQNEVAKITLNKLEILPNQALKTTPIVTESSSYSPKNLLTKSYWIENQYKYLVQYQYNKKSQIE